MTSRRTTSLTILAAMTAMTTAACGSTVSSSPAGDSEPAIDTLEVVSSANGVTLIATISDADDDLASTSIDWGDGTIDQFGAQIASIRADHTYAGAGPFAISVQALDAAGNTAVATTMTASDSATTAPAPTTTAAPAPSTTTPPTTAPPTTAPPTTAPPPTTPPSTAPPTTAPAPPDPISIDALGLLRWEVRSSPADDAGAEGFAQITGTNSVSLRAEALHGFNGRATAEATAVAVIDLGAAFAEFGGDYSAATVELAYEVSGSGVIKAPWDRLAGTVTSITVTTAETVGVSTSLQRVGYSLDEKVDSELRADFVGADTVTFDISPAAGELSIEVATDCFARSGHQVLALLGEGYCDIRRFAVESLDVTITPIG